MAAPNSEPLSLCKVLSESRRIVGPHRRHFQALCLLFLFPQSVVSLLYLYTSRQTPHLFQSELESSSLQITPYQYYFLLSLFNALFSNLFTLFASASVSYSVDRISRDEPVDLISSVKSISRAFWPLVSTSLVSSLIAFSIITPFLLLSLFVYKWLHHTWFLIPSVVLIGLAFAGVIIYLQVNWMLAYVVVVVESKWGYAPLKRSADLVKRNRGVALKVILYFAVTAGCFFWSFSGLSLGVWLSALVMLFGAFFISSILLGSLVATVVLYVYCREYSHEAGGVLVLDPSYQNSDKFPLLQ